MTYSYEAITELLEDAKEKALQPKKYEDEHENFYDYLTNIFNQGVTAMFHQVFLMIASRECEEATNKREEEKKDVAV